MLSDIGWAWAAGFFDGEGTTSLRKQRNYDYPKLSVPQAVTHREMQFIEPESEVLIKFQEVTGGFGRIHGPFDNGPRSKLVFRFEVNTRSHVEFILNGMWPYLSETKKVQAQNVLDNSSKNVRAKKPSDLITHGDAAKYRQGCRCTECLEAKLLQNAGW